MLAAVKGVIKDNMVIVENEDLKDYNGIEVVVTLLGHPRKQGKKKEIDWDSFGIPSERGQNVDEYMKEMRENDRI
ncbi:hypothetical protein D7V86_25740 [bacterium D16-51]|nr:hypothetical protein D7V96_26285 [bacterium D16-59]RKI52671.1 hypothetical protein D7V86_25740 [bacterium D16-51]